WPSAEPAKRSLRNGRKVLCRSGFSLALLWRGRLRSEHMFGLGNLRTEVEKAVASEDRIDPFELHQLRRMVEFLWVRSCEDYDRSEEWRDDGFATAGTALHKMCGLKRGTANRTITLGRKLRTLSETALAFSQGQ